MMNNSTLTFILKRLSLNLLYKLGGPFGIDKKTLSILCYHSLSNDKNRCSIEPNTCIKQIEKISTHANFISVAEAVEHLDGNKVPGPAVVLTFDDGYADVVNILPITKQHNIPVAIFVLSEPEHVNRKELDNPGELLGWDELGMLHKEGWTIGCHSATHADFNSLNHKQIQREIIDAKKILEDRLESEIEYFAYPKGVFNERIVEAVQKAGYKAAFSILPGCIKPGLDRWTLPRTVIDKTHIISEFPAVYSPTSFAIRKVTDQFMLWERFLSV